MDIIGVLLAILLIWIVIFTVLTLLFHKPEYNSNEKPKKCACNHECQAADCPCPTVPCGPDCKCKREDVFGF